MHKWQLENRTLRFGTGLIALFAIYHLWTILPFSINKGPPMAKKIPHKLSIHGDDRIDDYYWMRERDTPPVLDYLKKENEYLERELAPLRTLRQTLFEEMKGRIKKDDASVPVPYGEFEYYSRYEMGNEYPLYCRKKRTQGAEEEILLHLPNMAKGQSYFKLGSYSVSPNQKIMAYTIDTQGRRIYTIYFRDLTTGKDYQQTIPEVTSNLAWAADNKTLFYTKQDPETLRAEKIFRHTLGQSKDVLVYHEKDTTFNTHIYKTRSKRFLIIGSYSTLSTESRYLPADSPTGEFKVFSPREKNHEYSISDGGEGFYVVSNYKAKNFRLLFTTDPTQPKENWKEILPQRDDTLLQGVDVFKDYLVFEELKAGLSYIRIKNRKSGKIISVPFKDPAYTASVGTNLEYDTKTLRYTYESMTTPESIFDLDVQSQKSTLRKQKTVLGDFNPENYQSERHMVPSRDGVEIPLSLVYRKDFKKDGSQPVLLYGYGSYGLSSDPDFDSTRLSLLDRGFAFAIAHIRGGSEMGRQWYENGRQLKKRNTFYDFIDCSQYLIKEKFTSADRLYAYGGSAGGLLMGAVINLRPDLYDGIVADVPFVDVLTTMLDESIPLTTGEFDEWGNPKSKAFYDYMKTYSPYDNVSAQDYPALLVSTGYHDSQVQYWEPAKWVAKLREFNPENRRIFLKTEMDTGHSGASGRFESLKLEALHYAFYIDLAQKKKN